MPIVTIECQAGLAPGLKSRIASEMTARVEAVIKSPLDLISVVFHELAPDNSYRSGLPTSDTLVFCHIREGRSDEAVLMLAQGMSEVWSRLTDTPEDRIEVVVALYPARHVVRGGQRLPEAPRV